MMGARQQSTGNSYLLRWEACKNVWIVTDSDWRYDVFSEQWSDGSYK